MRERDRAASIGLVPAGSGYQRADGSYVSRRQFLQTLDPRVQDTTVRGPSALERRARARREETPVQLYRKTFREMSAVEQARWYWRQRARGARTIRNNPEYQAFLADWRALKQLEQQIGALYQQGARKHARALRAEYEQRRYTLLERYGIE